MSKRMVKNAWERSYRCNKVFKPICFWFAVDVEGYQGWFGSIRSGCEVFFSATSLVCFFSTACQQKRGSIGAYSCFTKQPPRSTDSSCVFAWAYSDDFSKSTLKILRFYAFSPFLRSRVAADAPSAYTTLLPGCPNHRKDPLPAIFLTNVSTHSPRFPLRVYSNMFDRPKDKMCVIIRLMVVRNDHTGVFLGSPWLFDRLSWQSSRCLGLAYIVICIVCIEYYHYAGS